MFSKIIKYEKWKSYQQIDKYLFHIQDLKTVLKNIFYVNTLYYLLIDIQTPNMFNNNKVITDM